MAYCGPKGIPLSTFLEWPDSDRWAALEWQAWESRRCRSCGTHAEDWAEDRYAYQAQLHECEGCVRIQTASRSAEAQLPGVHIRMVKS